MKNLCDNLRASTSKSIDELEVLLERCAKDHPVIVRLLNLPKQALYELTKTHKNDLNSVWGLVHSLHHAFVDDGDWSIIRKVNKDLEWVFGELELSKEELPYKYEIMDGDWTLTAGVEAIRLYEEDWDELIDTYMLHINYYNDNREAIDSHSEEENNKYWELVGKSDELYGKWFNARLN